MLLINYKFTQFNWSVFAAQFLCFLIHDNCHGYIYILNHNFRIIFVFNRFFSLHKLLNDDKVCVFNPNKIVDNELFIF